MNLNNLVVATQDETVQNIVPVILVEIDDEDWYLVPYDCIDLLDHDGIKYYTYNLAKV